MTLPYFVDTILRSLPHERDDGIMCGDPFWKMEDIRKAVDEIVELIYERAWLALKFDDESVSYALLEFAMSDGDGGDLRVRTVFHGHGYAGALREMRHTYFTNDIDKVDGYLFYAPAEAICAAFKYLEKYFDLD